MYRHTLPVQLNVRQQNHQANYQESGRSVR